MALSKSAINAQDIIACDLCESDTKLKWKCLDCELSMCNKCCDKIHPKIKNAKDHTILDINQLGVSDFTNIKCKVHTSQSCCIFCSNCDKLACPSCITKGHAGHTFIEIKEAYEIKVEWLKKRKEKLEMDEKLLDDEKITLNKETDRENSNCQKTIQDIQHQREALKKEVDEYALKLIEEVNQNLKYVKDSIFEEEKNVTVSKQKVKNNFKTAEEMLTTINMSFFFESADIIQKSLDDVESVKITYKRVPYFKPGGISQSNVGSLHEVVRFSNTKIDMNVNYKELTTELDNNCDYIAASSYGSFWIGSWGLLHKVKPEGNILTTVSTINTAYVEDLAVTHNNEILILDLTSKLKLLDEMTGELSDSKYSVDPLVITAFHITSDHKVIVGAKSPDDEFPVIGRRVVIVMDEEGNHLTVYEHDEHKQRIFSYPSEITSIACTRNGNIFVVDNDQSRLLVLGKDGDILNYYNSNKCPVMKERGETLQIASITPSPSNNIVLIDNNHNLQILDNSANLLFYSDLLDIGIESPNCLLFKNSTTFYLECPSSHYSDLKLYEIQCSGF